jgi:glycine oxidase
MAQARNGLRDLPRVAIVGGGVIGLAVGWRLAQAGCTVSIYERGTPGRGASWAAAGMLAPQIEAEPGEQALLGLMLESQKLWPAFHAEIERAGGRPVPYRREGTLSIALDRDDAEAGRRAQEFQRSLGLSTQWLNAAQVRAREPHLHPDVRGGIFSPHDHAVDNRALTLALITAFRSAGGALQENAAVDEVTVSNGRAIGLVVGGEAAAADVVVIAAGAWSRTLPGLPLEARPPVSPLKGQMLALQMDQRAPLLSHVVWAPGIYMVPRDDGRLILGATMEEKGFDPHLTAGGMLELLRAAWEALPGIDELPILEQWVGFRPTSTDDAPILGPTSVEGLVMATGHHRNGIQLAPITAAIVADHILTGEVASAMRPFTLARFARALEPAKAAS